MKSNVRLNFVPMFYIRLFFYMVIIGSVLMLIQIMFVTGLNNEIGKIATAQLLTQVIFCGVIIMATKKSKFAKSRRIKGKRASRYADKLDKLDAKALNQYQKTSVNLLLNEYKVDGTFKYGTYQELIKDFK